jgi:hypothetical protein
MLEFTNNEEQYINNFSDCQIKKTNLGIQQLYTIGKQANLSIICYY